MILEKQKENNLWKSPPPPPPPPLPSGHSARMSLVNSCLDLLQTLSKDILRPGFHLFPLTKDQRKYTTLKALSRSSPHI